MAETAKTPIDSSIKVLAQEALLHLETPMIRSSAVCVNGDVIEASEAVLGDEEKASSGKVQEAAKRYTKAEEAIVDLQQQMQARMTAKVEADLAKEFPRLAELKIKIEETVKPFGKQADEVMENANALFQEIQQQFGKRVEALQANGLATQEQLDVLNTEMQGAVNGLRVLANDRLKTLQKEAEESTKAMVAEIGAIMADPEFEALQQEIVGAAQATAQVQFKAQAVPLIKEYEASQAQMKEKAKEMMALTDAVFDREVARLGAQCKAAVAGKAAEDVAPELKVVQMRSYASKTVQMSEDSPVLDIKIYNATGQCSNGKAIETEIQLPFSAVDAIGKAPAEFNTACKSMGQAPAR